MLAVMVTAGSALLGGCATPGPKPAPADPVASLPSLKAIHRQVSQAAADVDAIDQPLGETDAQRRQRLGLPPKAASAPTSGMTIAPEDFAPENDSKVLALDLNEDQAPDKLEIVDPSLCGNGGCPYEAFDGKTHKRLGWFFGSPLLILDQRINGYSVVQSWSHLSYDSGTLTTWVFDGAQYQHVSEVELIGESATKFFDGIKGYRRP